MNRFILIITVAIAATMASAQRASADDPPPTKEQLAAAKDAFGQGKQLHDAGKLGEAIEKFKESYRLSRNPVLLYNIGLTLDENNQKDLALFYYRKFLSDAPQDAAQRKAAGDRVQALEKEKLEADLNKPDVKEPKPDVKEPKPDVKEPKPDVKVKIKPAGTYGATDFQHQIVEEAPPNKPLDVTAFVPEDSGFTVTLYYRGAGDADFKAKVMKWRYKELVARIPAKKVAGSSIQYYVEAKDQAGNVIAKAGKSTSPNLINIDASATARFYPDFTDDGNERTPTNAETRHHDEEDPLSGHQDEPKQPVENTEPEVPTTPGNGFNDVGSTKFNQAKWGSTIAAGTLLGVGIVFYVLASNQASNLVSDANHTESGEACTAPCHSFDGFDQDIQSAGQRNQTISNLGIGFGVVATAVAGYFWYRELTAKKHGELKVTTQNSSPEATWIVVPTIGDAGDATKFYGAAAAARF